MMAAATDLDHTKAQQDAKGEDVAKVLEQNAADVTAFNIRQTPTFFIAGEELVEFGPQQLADAVQAAQKSLIEWQTPTHVFIYQGEQHRNRQLSK